MANLPSPAESIVSESAEAEFRASQLEREAARLTEQIKLRATALNLIAVGFVVTGVIAPIAQFGAGIVDKPIRPEALGIMAIWLLLALILHYGATLVLRSLP